MGSKAVFGVLLIFFGIVAAWLAITGNLQNVWSIIITGGAPASTSASTTVSAAPSTTVTTPTTSTPTSSVTIPTSPAFLPATSAQQISSGLDAISQLEDYNYEEPTTLPSSATVSNGPISSYSSVYSQTPTTPTLPLLTPTSVNAYSTSLESQSGVTGAVA